MWIIILVVLTVVASIAIAYGTMYNKFQDSIIKLNEVEGKIDETLRNKFDHLIEMNNIIKETIKSKKEVIEDLNKYKEKKVTTFELDRKLSESLSKINFVRKQYTELHDVDNLNKLAYEVDEFDESLAAYKKYYNETLVDYNKLIRRVPYNFIGKIHKYSEKNFFDERNHNDDDIKDFKL